MVVTFWSSLRVDAIFIRFVDHAIGEWGQEVITDNFKDELNNSNCLHEDFLEDIVATTITNIRTAKKDKPVVKNGR